LAGSGTENSIPADYASFPIFEQLFTRISVDDWIEANASSFSCEMREMAFILQNVTRASLVLVDELGRGTSATDGLAIALAICGALIESRVYCPFGRAKYRQLCCSRLILKKLRWRLMGGQGL
jgi:DNA mismatch repair ATPase MutS